MKKAGTGFPRAGAPDSSAAAATFPRIGLRRFIVLPADAAQF
ncbi:hypothetical protein RGUI_0395 [Rhodovulum sp. P5]|nr:hypothetical protein RGUI_0395 [Rhodovulum sp. P5]